VRGSAKRHLAPNGQEGRQGDTPGKSMAPRPARRFRWQSGLGRHAERSHSMFASQGASTSRAYRKNGPGPSCADNWHHATTISISHAIDCRAKMSTGRADSICRSAHELQIEGDGQARGTLYTSLHEGAANP
jgi:hypothetical protein